MHFCFAAKKEKDPCMELMWLYEEKDEDDDYDDDEVAFEDSSPPNYRELLLLQSRTCLTNCLPTQYSSTPPS